MGMVEPGPGPADNQQPDFGENYFFHPLARNMVDFIEHVPNVSGGQREAQDTLFHLFHLHEPNIVFVKEFR